MALERAGEGIEAHLFLFADRVVIQDQIDRILEALDQCCPQFRVANEILGGEELESCRQSFKVGVARRAMCCPSQDLIEGGIAPLLAFAVFAPEQAGVLTAERTLTNLAHAPLKVSGIGTSAQYNPDLAGDAQRIPSTKFGAGRINRR